MRTTFINTLYELAANDRHIMLLTGDLGFTVFETFRDRYPRQFINVGVAEGNMMSIAAGLALTGKIVFAYSIATFATLRPLEQIRNDIASHNAHVCVVGTGGGLSYSDASITHHAMEDIALMRVIPKMTVLCPGDPTEAAWATRTAATISGPAYLRLGKQKDVPLYSGAAHFVLGRGSILTRGKNLAVLATGNIVANTLAAVDLLSKKGMKATLVSMHTIKPIDTRWLRQLLRDFGLVVTVEEHSRVGGLGSAIAESIADFEWRGRLVRLGIPDRFVYSIGSLSYVRESVGLTPALIAHSIGRAFRQLADQTHG